MTPNSRWQRIEAAFHALADLPAGLDRDARLSELCGDDGGIAREVSSMLEHDDRLTESSATVDPHVGLRLGSYHVDRLIARGGMAAVYDAHRGDDQFHQRVAVKIMDLRLSDPALVARFKAERQILAALEHPTLTRLLDGGVTAFGEPYLVMEYVAGVPIDRHCDSHRLDVPARLRLFGSVCDAIAFAHRNLVLHRDLKPSNILVTSEGQVKVVDFGTATLLDPERSSTITRAPLTPAYASPEQLTGQAVGTASDQYSLGLVLYELLTGTSAFPHDVSLMSSMERALIGTQPAAPHTTVTATAADARQISVPRLRRHLSGDLGTIVRKALATDPRNRYASVQHLADDLVRWSNGEPILGRAPSLAYHAARFVQRHWVATSLVATLLVGLAVATSASVQQAVVARRQAAIATTESAKAGQLNRFLTQMLTSAVPGGVNPEAARALTITVRDVLDRASTTVGTELGATPELEAEMRRTIGRTYLSLGATAQGDLHLERALALYRAQGNAVQMAITDVSRSRGLIDRGQFAEGEQLLRAAVTVLRHHEDRVDFETLFSAMNNLALTLTRRDPTNPEGLALLREGVAMGERRGLAPFFVAQAAANLGMSLMVVGDLDGSEEMLRSSLRLLDRQPSTPPERGWTLRHLSELMRTRGNYREAVRFGGDAVEAAAAAYPATHAAHAIFKTTWGRALVYDGQAARAEIVLLEAYDFFKKTRPAGHQDLLGPQLGLGPAYRQQGRLRESEAVLREARKILAAHPSFKSLAAGAAGELGLTLRDAGNHAEAKALLNESYLGFKTVLGDAHPYSQLALARLRGGG